ncbi:MAG TPA: hypothetical protein PLO62_15745 [Candidatus Hydrogenedentes bacterium]|nr:hypothetical protein [Candidatus Hydrogenedentota bacterium]
MRQSRRKTLAAIVEGAMHLQDTGVLALGRSMTGECAAKHRIKRVDRFLGNEQAEVTAYMRRCLRLVVRLRVKSLFWWTGPTAILSNNWCLHCLATPSISVSLRHRSKERKRRRTGRRHDCRRGQGDGLVCLVLPGPLQAHYHRRPWLWKHALARRSAKAGMAFCSTDGA